MPIIRVVDLETTGLRTDAAPRQGVVEFGWTDVGYNDAAVHAHISEPRGLLVKTPLPIEVSARAVHHITDEEIDEFEVDPDEAFAAVAAGEHALYCAHNVDHEKEFFGGGELPWICTYKCGVRVWPDAPGHKLGELRYHLGVDKEPEFQRRFCERPHRAPDDAYVGAFVLRRLLLDSAAQGVGFDALLRWSKGPALLHTCFMKKHKGTRWADVPSDYMLWILEKSDVKDRDIIATVRYHLRRRGDIK